MDPASASIAPGTKGSSENKMRWLADELDALEPDPTDEVPYREGHNYICRNCAADMGRYRRAFCGRCKQIKQRQEEELDEATFSRPLQKRERRTYDE